MKINKNKIHRKTYIALLVTVMFNNSVCARDFNSEVNLDDIGSQVFGGDSITVNATGADPVTGLKNSYYSQYIIDMAPSESISVDVIAPNADATGMSLVSSTHLGSDMYMDLGTGTSVNVESGKNAVGLLLTRNNDLWMPGKITAKDLSIDVKGQESATGLLFHDDVIPMYGEYGKAYLDGGTINVASDGYATAIHIKNGEELDAPAELHANNLSLISDGKFAYGLIVEGSQSAPTELKNTTILLKDDKGLSEGGSGILLDSSGDVNLIASGLNIIANGDNRHGIILKQATKNVSGSTIQLGSDSSILTTGNGGSAIIFTDDSDADFYAKHIKIVTQGESANLVEANNGRFEISDGSILKSEKSGGLWASNIDSKTNAAPTIKFSTSALFAHAFGALAQGENSEINLRNAIISTEVGPGLQADNQGVITAKSTAVISNSGVGIKALSGGRVDFNGKTIIKSNSNSSIESIGNDSAINGIGTAYIYGDIKVSESGQVALELSDGSQINGSTIKSDESGKINISLSGNSLWQSTGESVVDNLILDNSALYLSIPPSDSFVGNTVTVNGNYEGKNGHIYFSTVLDDDNSATDKLLINGDTSGSSLVSVNNVGGKGAETVEGIELIHVSGNSDGEFTQSGRIVAGAYDYNLVRGYDTNSNHWYLTSYQPLPTGPIEPIDPSMPEVGPIITDPIEPIDPSMPEVGPIITDPIEPIDPSMPEVGPIVTDPIEPIDPSMPEIEPEKPTPPPPSSGKHVNRPESGSYIANIAAANTLFNTRLHDRLGETQYIDALTGEEKVTSLWLRQVGGHNNWRDSSGQLKTQSNSYVAQLGGDVVQWSSDGLNRGHLGLMTGYANSHSKTHSSVTGYDSKGSINGYSAGIYGTWFANETDKSGVYIDSWLQYSWFNNHVNGEQLASESYKSKGLTASLETGYNLKIGESNGSQGTLNEWFIQPQAQATWMGVKADKHKEDNGTRVSSDGDGNIQTRLGVRAYMKSHHAMDEDKVRNFEPFIEANWLHNTRSYSAKMDDVRINQAGARNLGEIKVGLEGQINPRVNVWGNVGAQVGDKGYNDSSAMIGVKYNF